MSDPDMTDAILEVAKSIDGLARAVRFLGNGDAATHFGAIEAFGMHIGEKMMEAAVTLANVIEESK